MSIADLRKDYQMASLSKADVDRDAMRQFTRWFDEALTAELKEPNAMSLATVSAEGRPTSRIVLIKDVDERGFCWFTNYDSSKGEQLASQPYAALLFHWVELERQVRIEGRVEKLSAADNDRYFYSRPLGSQYSALASQQSQIIDSRATLEKQLDEVKVQYGDHPERPPHWGGYRLVPDKIEFWQGRSSRLHDRILYARGHDEAWTIARLQP